MNIAAHRDRTNAQIAAMEVATLYDSRQTRREIEQISTLVDRFNQAHARLNQIELALHDGIGGMERVDLLRSLEDARTEYMDARFAMNTTPARR